MRRRRFKEYLFVDAYNIIHSWGSLKEKAKIDLEEARLDLIETLAEYHHYSSIGIIVVFDAHEVKRNMGHEEEYKGIKVVYTKESETADHYIERQLERFGKIRRIRVATSDRLEQEMVLSRGGTRLSARELEAEIFDQMRMAKRQSDNSRESNDNFLGRLDDDLIEKLEKLKKSVD